MQAKPVRAKRVKRARLGDPHVAVGYLRVSTEDQQLGPEAQRAAIASWAERAGIRIASWHQDDGVSGATAVGARAALTSALQAVRHHGAGALVVAKRDRSARAVSVATELERVLAGAGARLLSADGAGNGTEPADQFMRRMLDGMSEYERELIRSRTKAALAVKKRRGERTGSCPFGYKAGEGGTLKPDEGEQFVAATIFRLRLAGMTERQIAEVLRMDGVRSRGDLPIGQTQVHRVLKRCVRGSRLIDRPVQPFEGVVVHVDLFNVIEPFGSIASHRDVDPVIDWIDRGAVDLDVISLSHVLSPESLPLIEKLTLQTSGVSFQHKRLCATAAAFLVEQGKEVDLSANSLSTYSAGIADVRAVDGSIFVECGTLGADKVKVALQNDQTILVVPYNLGCSVEPEDEAKLGKDVILAYKFTPIDRVATRDARAAEDKSLSDAVQSLNDWGEHPTTGQPLVNRRRVVSIAYRRDGKPADMKWLRDQVVGLRARKVPEATIVQVLLKLGVRRGDGAAIDVNDLKRQA